MADLSKLRINRDEEQSASTGAFRKIVWLLVVVAIVVTAVYLYMGPLKPATEVRVTTVIASSPSQINSVLAASGYVVAQRKAEVASKGTGKLEQLRVEEGTVVKKGDIVGRLESRDLDAALAQAKADLEVAKASLSEARSLFARHKTLVDQELVSRNEYDVSQAQYQRAQAAVDSAKARVRGAEVEVENTYIRAPFDGTVLTKNADVGEIVAPFAAGNSKGAVVSMADMSSLQVEADVSESNIERVRPGQPCEITLDAIPQKRYRGVVHMIVPTADRAKATVLTKVRFVDRDERVLPEMSAKVTFLSKEMNQQEAEAKPKILVDPAAVVNNGTQKQVYALRQNRAVATPVSVGKMVGNTVEVLQGVSPGDQVILNPPADLRSGTEVKIQQ